MAAIAIEDTWTFLIGTWALERTIEDHVSATAGWVSGRAALVATGPAGNADYHETGSLQFGPHRGTATRRLRYIRQAGSVEISFPDGRPFVTMDLRKGSCQRVHLCGGDRQEITTTVLSREVVEERWRVRGATTNYDVRTILTRI